MQYLTQWPEYFQVAESPDGTIMGYGRIHHNVLCHMSIIKRLLVMGKSEGMGEKWHGHVTALTVGPDYRRLGLAATLMNFLEEVSEK